MAKLSSTELTQANIDFLKHLLFKLTGIHISDRKENLFKMKIKKMINEGKLTNLAAFYRKLKQNDPPTVAFFLKYTTTNWTFFFREREQLDFVIGMLNKQNIKYPKIWSAACSSGEEPYSIAILLQDSDVLNYTIVASDIDHEMLLKTSKGEYAQKCLSNCKGYENKYFDKKNGGYKIKRDIRRRVKVKRIDLQHDMNFTHLFNVILLRNVLIYFDANVQAQVIDRIVANLNPGGYLIIGKTDLMHSTNPRLKRTAIHGVFHYV